MAATMSHAKQRLAARRLDAVFVRAAPPTTMAYAARLAAFVRLGAAHRRARAPINAAALATTMRDAAATGPARGAAAPLELAAMSTAMRLAETCLCDGHLQAASPVERAVCGCAAAARTLRLAGSLARWLLRLVHSSSAHARLVHRRCSRGSASALARAQFGLSNSRRLQLWHRNCGHHCFWQ